MSPGQGTYQQRWREQIRSAGVAAGIPVTRMGTSVYAYIQAFNCKRCGDAFIPKAGASDVYCSDECSDLALTGCAEPDHCRVCGGPIGRRVAKAGLPWCSDGCRSRRFDHDEQSKPTV